jgi:hypothetical protein
MTDDDPEERAKSERQAQISADLRRRIRPVCPRMPGELFLEMIESMAAIQLKYELHDDPAEDGR